MATEAYDTAYNTVLADTEAARGVTIGTVVNFNDAGQPIIQRAGVGESATVSRSIVPLADLVVGRDVALLFEAGESSRPIIIGVLQQATPADAETLPVEVEADGKRVVLTGTNEVVLRCGKASIQLLSDGTIRLRGTNVLSRASATNRIRGGNVQIN